MKRTIISAESANELFHKIKDYFEQYHPNGYGTYIEKIVSNDKEHYAQITRSSSCD